MNKTDLKLESVNVRVSNANQENKVYDIEANFYTKNHELQRVENGVVRKDGEMYASFHKNYEGITNTTSYTFYAVAAGKDIKSQIIGFVEDFEETSEGVISLEIEE